MDIFVNIGKPIANSVNESIRYVVIEYGDTFESISDILLVLLIFIERSLRAVPAPLFILAIMLLAYAAGRRISLSIGVGMGLYLIGCLELWDQAMQTIAIMLVAVFLSLLLGLPIGVICARSRRFRAILLNADHTEFCLFNSCRHAVWFR